MADGVGGEVRHDTVCNSAYIDYAHRSFHGLRQKGELVLALKIRQQELCFNWEGSHTNVETGNITSAKYSYKKRL